MRRRRTKAELDREIAQALAPRRAARGGPLGETAATFKTLKGNRSAARDTLRTRLQIFIDKWEPTLGVDVRSWDIKPMKNLWASVNEQKGLVTFNEKLADMPDAFVESIVVHELVHFLTDGHDEKFHRLMDRHVPGWRKLQSKHEDPLLRHN